MIHLSKLWRGCSKSAMTPSQLLVQCGSTMIQRLVTLDFLLEQSQPALEYNIRLMSDFTKVSPGSWQGDRSKVAGKDNATY